MLAQLRSTLTQVLQVGVAYRQITHQLATGEVTGGVEAHAITIPAAALDRVQGYLAAVADELAAAPVTELAQSQPLANGRLDDNVPSQEPSPTPERTPAEDTCQ
jgi:hypothetical protein